MNEQIGIIEFINGWKSKCKSWNNIDKRINENEFLIKELKEKTFFLNIQNPTIYQRLWHIIHNKYEIEYCFCGKSKQYQNGIIKGYRKSCGNLECSKKSEKSSCLEKYGFTSAMSSPDVLKKYKESTFKKHGVEVYFKSKEIIEKKKQAFKKKFEKDNPYIKMSENNDIVFFNCDNCKSDSNISRFHFVQRKHKYMCYNCVPLSGTSSIKELELFNYLKNKYPDLEIISKYKIPKAKGKEIDIFFPQLNIGIEFNGVYWHTEQWLDKNYHINKLKLCNDRNIKLLHVWEDDLENLDKKEIILSIIQNKILKNSEKIFARKCIIKEINSKLEREFLNKNHIQGYVASNHKLGLFYNEELVSIMTFSKSRKILNSLNKYDFELLRFCNKLNTNVIGAGSKLFKHFIMNNEFKTIVSYSNIERYSGGIYEILNFKNDGVTPPNYWWSRGGNRHHRWNFRKNKLVEQGYDKNKTEVQIMHDRGYYRVWDCGNIRWIYSK